MTTFDFKCPQCGAIFQAEEEWVGQTGECSECGREIVIRKALTYAKPFQTEKKTAADEGDPLTSKLLAPADPQSVSTAEMKKKLRGSFVEMTEDDWGLFRHGKTKEAIRLEEILDAYSVLDMEIVYVKKNKADSVVFTFTYLRDCDNEISDTCINMKMRLVLDDDKIIELAGASGWESDFLLVDKKHMVKEKIQLAVPIQDMTDIAGARKIEYGIETDNREIKGKLDRHQLQIVKGFYNNAFDGDFELENLYKTMEQT